jgi:hypothetical protein
MRPSRCVILRAPFRERAANSSSPEEPHKLLCHSEGSLQGSRTGWRPVSGRLEMGAKTRLHDPRWRGDCDLRGGIGYHSQVGMGPLREVQPYPADEYGM